MQFQGEDEFKQASNGMLISDQPNFGKYNLFKESRIGYSFGLGFPPDWGENTISVRHGDTTVIQENMCLHFILGCGDEWGYEYSEALIVTKTGPELLCKTPRMLFLRK